MKQIILHLLGDYVFQTDKMAQSKTSSYMWAGIHALVYSLPFLLLTKGFNLAWFVIFITHLLIDRHRLTKYWTMFYNMSWIKKEDRFTTVTKSSENLVGEMFVEDGIEYIVTGYKKQGAYYHNKAVKYVEGTKTFFNRFRVNNTATGFSDKTPIWLSTWLMIIVDNTTHITINYLCLTYLM